MVQLTWGEIDLAGYVAVERQRAAIQQRMRSGYGLVEEGLGLDAQWQGCIGEVAVCKHLGCDWDAVSFGVVDAGVAEVRSIDRRGCRLILHEKGKDFERQHLPFVLALVERDRLPEVDLVGWVIGTKGMQEEYWEDPTRKGRWAFFVPPGLLEPVERLRPYLGIF
jgi:hypothetical protein